MILLPGFCASYTQNLTKGRPRSLRPIDALGLTLCYLTSSATNTTLQLIFGITPAVCSREIARGLTALLLFVGACTWTMMTIHDYNRYA